jgi:hypothetical protein
MNLLFTVAVRALEVLFVAGAAGSLLVVILAGLEDLRTMFRSEETSTQ